VLASSAVLRPRYGGTLRVETNAGQDLHTTQFAGQIYETLVRSDSRGEIKPLLATGWIHDPATGKWIFSARKNVLLSNGSLWTPGDDALIVPDTKPLDQILVEAGLNDKVVMESGPFRILNQRTGEFVRLVANENYWGGRPFLDSVEIQLGRTRRDQLLDFELGKADVVEAEITEIKTLKQPNMVLQVSKPLETIALAFENAKISSPVRQAVALSIDRSAMQRVMLDKQGEVSGALLPQWISGYAFLFSTARDVARAKDLAPAGTTLSLCADVHDKVLRSLADRIAVDVSQAGIAVRTAASGCDARLVRLPITSLNPRQALLNLASGLRIAEPAWAPPYAMECELLRDYRVVPLFHFPFVYVLRPNVRNWSGQGDLADVWLAEAQ
jgi:MarR-like DNA-binding transcriptional regulator SgrR of sgrS sRNA